MKSENIFRNSKNFYLENEDLVSPLLLKFVTKHSGKKILDLGCATGDYCKKLKDLGYKCVGVDNNPAYVKKAKEKDVESYLMSGENLDFPDKFLIQSCCSKFWNT